MSSLKTRKNYFKIFTVVFLCVLLVTGGTIFTGCADDGNFEEVQAAALEDGKPILLYISKTNCPNCVAFDPDWQNAKNIYGDQVHFYYTKIGKNKEASDLYAKYSPDFREIVGSPALVWITSDGTALDGTSGTTKCESKLWRYFNEGLSGWWNDSASAGVRNVSIPDTDTGTTKTGFETIKLAALEDGKPILLYIGKGYSLDCTQFNAEWQHAKTIYGGKVHFYYTERGLDAEADDIFSEFSLKFANVKDSPALVWLTAEGIALDGIMGPANCKTQMWTSLDAGKEGWRQINVSAYENYTSFAGVKTAALSDGKPVLLFISKNGCPYCEQVKPEWQRAKNLYGGNVHFYFTQLGNDDDALALYNQYKAIFPKITGYPTLVWITSGGNPVISATGSTRCQTGLWQYFNQGLYGWWEL